MGTAPSVFRCGDYINISAVCHSAFLSVPINDHGPAVRCIGPHGCKNWRRVCVDLTPCTMVPTSSTSERSYVHPHSEFAVSAAPNPFLTTLSALADYLHRERGRRARQLTIALRSTELPVVRDDQHDMSRLDGTVYHHRCVIARADNGNDDRRAAWAWHRGHPDHRIAGHHGESLPAAHGHRGCLRWQEPRAAPGQNTRPIGKSECVRRASARTGSLCTRTGSLCTRTASRDHLHRDAQETQSNPT